MTRYLIIIAAILVGAFIGWLLSRPPKHPAQTTLIEERKINLWPLAGGLIVLLVGLFLLADYNRAPINTNYQPATIDNNTIKPGQFKHGFNHDKKGKEQ